MDSTTLYSLIERGWQCIYAQLPMLFPYAVAYALLATVGAIVLGWGRVFYEVVERTRVLKLPGGGLLASLPIPEMGLIGWVLSNNPTIAFGTPTWALVQFLTFFGVLRFTLAAATHVLSSFGSAWSFFDGHKFSIECMDSRCYHGVRSGNFLHYFACGGATLLTAITFAPLVLVPVFSGVPDGPLGWAMIAVCLFPYPLVFAKLFVNMFPEGFQYLFKVGTDVIMFFFEWPGWLLGSVTLTFASWLRPMWPGITRTSFHKHD
ncbi:MAG: hypothetical protein GW762_03305 [Candidatus Pacebacteria bacterium]|nr:hypothetical protein [Candidatus Paceibacterota bacterium]NCS97590.1 hypothetical protein [Candidatus Paceibacterota bacterium]PIR63529.1 MAG: hypothetical protein COU64_04075 [Candidatus Pacebacteria bacterium CG10_big_fil_rev_8_21_14_0_10_40_26]PIZ79408.1 MAG: hypothetical protein COY01_01005 [Candidatus Pacebacteria bacterium CG_4_10_14_0_2_um_filter_40_20]PJC41947.1 MAG: hypothetical protein CO041_01960 [Candidatus Pacebacteria bacterium CG_4_9_14_0_2_um_filter_40_15]